MIVPAAVQEYLWCRLLEWRATFTRCIHPNRDLPVTAWTSCGVQVVIPNCFYTLYLTFTLPNHAILTHTAYLPPTPLPFTPSLPLLPHTIPLPTTPPSPSSAALGPVKHLVYGCDSLLPHWDHVTTCHYGVLQT